MKKNWKHLIFGLTLVGLTLFVIHALHHFRPKHEIAQTPMLASDGASYVHKAASPSVVCDHLSQIVCQKTGTTFDPTGFVRSDMDGEKRTLQIYQKIIKEHKNWSSAQVDEELVKQIYTPAHRQKFQIAYTWVEKELENLIQNQPESVFTNQEKTKIKNRLRQVQLELPPPASLYADEPDLVTKNDIYYERLGTGQMKLRVGGAYFQIANSWFNLVFTLAHEFAHAIDPCEIRSVNMAFPAYDRLMACFIHTGLIATRKTRTECGQDDQSSEIFADWIAVQITAEALRKFSTEFRGPQLLNAVGNAVRDLCDQEGSPNELDLEFHPDPKIRIENIFGKNPAIRGLLGCSPVQAPTNYCSFEPSFNRGGQIL